MFRNTEHYDSLSEFKFDFPHGHKEVPQSECLMYQLEYVHWGGGGSVAQLTLATPWTGTPPGSSVHGILQARILEGVAISFSRETSRPRDHIWVSYKAGGFFTDRATREVFSLFPPRNSENCLSITSDSKRPLFHSEPVTFDTKRFLLLF